MIVIIDAYKRKNNKNIKTLFSLSTKINASTVIVRCMRDMRFIRDDVTHIIISGSERFLSDCSTCIYDIHPLLSLINVYPNAKVLGICFGFQFINFIHGGKISPFGSLVKQDVVVNNEALHFNFNDVVHTIGMSLQVVQRVSINNKSVITHIKNDRFVGLAFHPEFHTKTYYYITSFLKK